MRMFICGFITYSLFFITSNITLLALFVMKIYSFWVQNTKCQSSEIAILENMQFYDFRRSSFVLLFKFVQCTFWKSSSNSLKRHLLKKNLSGFFFSEIVIEDVRSMLNKILKVLLDICHRF